jgi:hypothetical protein
MSVVVAACSAHAQGVSEGPKPSRAALDARPIPWKTGSLELIPTTIQHLQVIVTPGFKRGEHFAWFTAGGSDVVVVFHATSDDVDEMNNELNRRYLPSQGVPGDKRSFVIFGTYKGPGGPPDPGPGGFPGPYVELVMKLSFDVNIAQIHLDEARLGIEK